MSRLSRISLTLAALLLAVLAGSCTLRELTYRDQPQLYVNVYIPDAVATRAEVGTHSALSAEKAVNTLQIWVFRAGATANDGLIGYKSLDTDDIASAGLSGGSEARFSIPVEQ